MPFFQKHSELHRFYLTPLDDKLRMVSHFARMLQRWWDRGSIHIVIPSHCVNALSGWETGRNDSTAVFQLVLNHGFLLRFNLHLVFLLLVGMNLF